MTLVRFYDPAYEPELPLLYSIISARLDGRWIFVRHHDRQTWEIPGGHIEIGERPYDAAFRELTEETGASEFSLECVATYSVSSGDYTGFGRLYLSEVKKLGEITDKSEIAEIMLCENLPPEATYPDIQSVLLNRCMEYLRNKKYQ